MPRADPSHEFRLDTLTHKNLTYMNDLFGPNDPDAARDAAFDVIKHPGSRQRDVIIAKVFIASTQPTPVPKLYDLFAPNGRDPDHPTMISPVGRDRFPRDDPDDLRAAKSILYWAFAFGVFWILVILWAFGVLP